MTEVCFRCRIQEILARSIAGRTRIVGESLQRHNLCLLIPGPAGAIGPAGPAAAGGTLAGPFTVNTNVGASGTFLHLIDAAAIQRDTHIVVPPLAGNIVNITVWARTATPSALNLARSLSLVCLCMRAA